jgi:tetratricopeptide (TPR) repeat protein
VLQARRARAHLQREEWSEAAAHYGRALELGSTNGSVWYALALVQLQLGKTEEYRRTCAGMLKHFVNTQETRAAAQLIDACTLVDGCLSDWGPLVKLAEKQAAAKVTGQLLSPDLLGMVLYRAGRFQEATDKLKYSTGSAGLVRAMAQYRLNHKEEARQTLAKVIQDLEKVTARRRQEGNVAPRLAWHLRLKIRLLRREAETLMQDAKGH